MKRFTLAFVAALCAVASPAFATNGMRMTGFGPVQDSMGGVGVGAALDGAAMMSNPAGLIGLPAQLEVAGTYFKPTVSYSATESPMPAGMTGMIVAQPGVQMNSGRGASPIPTLAWVRPIDENFTFGLGAFGVSGMGVDYAANLYGGPTYTSYMQLRLTPSIAYRVTPALTVGVTVNAMMAQMNWNVAQGLGQMPHDTSTSWGIGGTLGARLSMTDWLTVGAAYETRSYFNDFRFEIPAHTGYDPATLQPVQFAAGTDKVAFDQPMSATIGVAVKPVAPLLFAADVQWIDWSSTNGADLPQFSQNQSGAMSWDLGWKDQWVFKFGAQLAVLDSLRLRAGYNYGKMPLDANCAFENLAFPAVSEHHFSAGVGWDFGRWTLNAGATVSPKASLSGSNPQYPAQGGQAIQSYTTSMSQYAIDAGLTFRL